MQVLRMLCAVALYALVPGCGHDGHTHADHEESGAGHVHEAPHGGVLIVCEDEVANIELCPELDLARLRFYVLDGHATNPVRIEQPEFAVKLEIGGKSLDLMARARESNPRNDEKPGDSSEFVLEHPDLKDAKDYKGSIGSITIRGKTYTNVPFSAP